MFYHITTYGCQMNIHESEKAAAIFESRGLRATDEQEKADVILFNTCCIREGAENRAIGNIGAVKRLKQINKNLITIVVGCMAQQASKAESLCKKFPYIDIILGTHNLMSLGDKLDEMLNSRLKTVEIVETDASDMDAVKAARTSGLNAWVNIMYGCNNFCTYCIVPYVRGREHSRSAQDVYKEVETAVLEGYREVTLLGQNVNSYGNDRADGIAFPQLLQKLATIDGQFRIKYMTSHPKDFTRALAEVMQKSDRIANYLHLPVQSGSDRILKEMNRHYTRKDYLDEISMVRRLIPEIGLSTDIMVGFPGETEDDFDATMDLVRRVRYDNMFMFVYSRRSGTPADRMKNQVPTEVKDKRIHTLVEESRKISVEIAETCVGKEFSALAEFADGKLTASSDNGRFITLDSKDQRLHGQFVRVKVTGHSASKLYGKVCE